MVKFNKLSSQKRAREYRKRILEISQKVTALHIGGTFSCAEIMEVIFNYFIKTKSEMDCFILSKGHASILHYAILEQKKLIKKQEMDNYCKKKGYLGVHPDRGNPGINASTGSLGHGLGMAVGVAIAEKQKNTKVFVVLSDGELQEGSTWEAIMLIPALKLKNVIMIIDNNNLQSLEKTSKTHPNLYPIEKKLSQFGWSAQRCNGHNAKQIFDKIYNRDKKKPFALIAETIKGYPVSYMMNKPIWHYKSPDKKQYLIAIKDLDKKI